MPSTYPPPTRDADELERLYGISVAVDEGDDGHPARINLRVGGTIHVLNPDAADLLMCLLETAIQEIVDANA